jgi:hypothetical protein
VIPEVGALQDAIPVLARVDGGVPQRVDRDGGDVLALSQAVGLVPAAAAVIARVEARRAEAGVDASRM